MSKNQDIVISVMPTKDNFENEQMQANTLTRRRFLIALGNLSLLGALWSVARGSIRMLTPPISRIPSPIIVAGPPDAFEAGTLTPLEEGPVFIGRDQAGLFALSAVCTHLGCPLVTDDEGLACPCHGSHFSTDGTNLSGPATQPLPHLALAINDDGLLEVNLSQTVAPDLRIGN